MFHPPFGWYCSYCAAKLANGTSERKQKKTLGLSGRLTVYIRSNTLLLLAGVRWPTSRPHCSVNTSCKTDFLEFFPKRETVRPVRFFGFAPPTNFCTLPWKSLYEKVVHYTSYSFYFISHSLALFLYKVIVYFFDNLTTHRWYIMKTFKLLLKHQNSHALGALLNKSWKF